MDRDIFLFEKMNEIYDNKISFMIESLDTQMKINMLEAQYKVITESGTKEDFKYLYMEAKEETKEKEKSIFKRIVEWVIKIKDKLVDFFTKRKIDKEIDKLPDKFEIDKGYKKQFEGFQKFHKWIVRPIKLFKEKKYDELKEDLFKKVGAITAIAAGVVITDALVPIGKSYLKDGANWILKVFKTDCDEILKFCSSAGNDVVPIKFLKDMIGSLSNVINAAIKWCVVVPSHAVVKVGAAVYIGGRLVDATAGNIYRGVSSIKNDINNS